MPNPLPQIVSSGHSAYSAPVPDGYQPPQVIDLDELQARADRTAAECFILNTVKYACAALAFDVLVIVAGAAAWAGSQNIHHNIVLSQEP